MRLRTGNVRQRGTQSFQIRYIGPDGNTLPLFPDEPISPIVPPLKAVHYPKSSPLRARFEAFHKENPHVYLNIRAIALDMKARGIRRFGMKAIFERLRWLYKLQTRGDEYTLNNSWTAFYARILMQNETELEEFFETRVQRSEDAA